MLWLVDGYNVIRRDPDLRAREAEGLEAGRTALLHLLARVARASGERFGVVFDGARRMPGGAPSAGLPGGRAVGEPIVSVLFSTPPERADDVLMREAAKHRDGVVIVTSDRTVADAARRNGAVAVTAEDFLDAIVRSEDEDEGKPDEDDAETAPRGGNPRRLSRHARAVARALRRLRPIERR